MGPKKNAVQSQFEDHHVHCHLAQSMFAHLCFGVDTSMLIAMASSCALQQEFGTLAWESQSQHV